jgi:hypothetical protein
MEIKFRKNIDLGRSTLLAAIGKRFDNQYCLLLQEFSKISCVGMWASSNLSKLMRDDNPNLVFRDLEELTTNAENKILETSGMIKELYKTISEFLTTEKAKETINYERN